MNAAAHRFPHVLIRASAGTGKTFQLSNRFIDLALAGEPFDTMLATTFTRKAAGEILDRVLQRLADAALDPEKLAELAEHLAASKLDRNRCLGILRAMLRQLHRLRVGTLDSFFIQIAQSFSLDLGLPPGWQIVDEMVDQGLRAEAIRALLRDESTRDTVELMHLLTKGDASRSVSEQIALLVTELYSIYTEAPAEAWQSLPRRKGLKPDELQTALDTLAAMQQPDWKAFAKARDQDLDHAQCGDWKTFVKKGIAGKIAQDENTYNRKPIPAEMVAAYEPLIQHAKAELLGQIANQTAATHKLLERFDAAYRQMKTARRAMRFEDVTRELTDARMADRMDDVAYRLDAHVSHLLLDEFQDTSPAQWRVLRPFARLIVDRGGRRSFFCVGDVKQAIYGWRGGVAEIFEALSDELDHLQRRSLNRSWRSCQAVIDTVNRVFGNLGSNQVLQKYPAAARRWSERFQQHTTAYPQLPGYCRLVAAPAAGEGEKQEVVTLAYAAEQIETLHRQVPGKRIGVLVRKNEAVARLIYELRSRGVDASEEGGNPLTDSPAVQLVLSLLTMADHPGDTAARFHVANSPLAEHVGLTDHGDSAAAVRLAREIRRDLMTDGYGPTLYGWATRLARSCDRRDLNRLMQLVELAHGYEAQATTRTDDFVALVSGKKVEDPTAAAVRVMTVHQAKGLQFDVVVLPQLDVRLTGQTPSLVVGRPRPTGEVQRVCRYVAQDTRPLLPDEFRRMFDEHSRQVVEESLCVLYVAMTRAVHALHMIIAPSAQREKTIASTSAGLLRAALTEGKRAEPGAVLYEHGDPTWYEIAMAKERAVAVPVEKEAGGELLSVKLAEPPPRASRGLERRSPSQLEGGPRVNLAQRLRLDTATALDRGTLMHAWFEQIGWLEDGQPDDATLRQVADKLATGGLDVSALIGQFRTALNKPAIRAALSRATYQRPAGDATGCTVHAGPQVASPRWEVWRERPFAVRDEDAILSGFIDRLVVLYDGDTPVAADVLDFKTDAVAADDPQAIQARVEEYRPQLEAYRRAVSSLFNLDATRVSARLAFVEPGVIKSV